MGHTHKVIDADKYFSINPFTRVIANQSSKIVLIQGDHNSEKFSFVLPRYIENHDMLLCNAIEIHYINIDSATREQNKGMYEVEDLHEETEGNVSFSWEIKELATQLVGTLNFLIKFKCVENGNVTYRWSTGINSEVTVLTGIDNSGEIIATYPDILEQWKAQIFGDAENAVVNIKQAEQEAIKTVQLAGEEIENAAAIAEQNAKNVLANAIKGHLKGEVVTADNVSAVEHEMHMNVYSKNLFDVSKVITDHQNQVINNGDGTLTVNTSATSSAVPIIELTLKELAPHIKEGKTYVLSANSTGTQKRIWLDLSSYTWKFGESAIVTKEMLDSLMFVYASGNSTTAIISNIQIEEGEVATEYTPYVDPTTVKVTAGGKTYMPNADGTVDGILSSALADGISTDTEGVVIDCEYNVDTQTYIDRKFEELKALLQK